MVQQIESLGQCQIKFDIVGFIYELNMSAGRKQRRCHSELKYKWSKKLQEKKT